MLDAAYVTDIDQWVTRGEPLLFAIATLIIGVTVNRLTTRRKWLVAAAVARHQEMLRLFELSRDLASASGPEAMLARVNQHLGVLANAEAVLYLKDKGEYKRIGTVDIPFDATEQMAARWALDHREAAGMGTRTLPSARGIWLPLYVADRPVLGALAQALIHRVPFLRQNHLCRNWHPQAINRFASISRLVTYSPGSEVLIESHDSQGLFFIYEGQAEVTRQKRRLSRLGIGGFIGEIGLLQNSASTATVVADGPLSCLAIDKTVFFRFLTQNYEVGLEVETPEFAAVGPARVSTPPRLLRGPLTG